jgi:serine phosphatase RsbU (regulator of sigma subunit)
MERLGATGIALGMFDGSTYQAIDTAVGPGDLLLLYSDGITEAENPGGQPFEEAGLERFIAARGGESPEPVERIVIGRHGPRAYPAGPEKVRRELWTGRAGSSR